MRSMIKAIEQYEKLNQTHDKWEFLGTDIQQLHDIALGMSIPGRESSIIYNTILVSLEAGFAIGYRTAMRQKKQKSPA